MTRARRLRDHLGQTVLTMVTLSVAGAVLRLARETAEAAMRWRWPHFHSDPDWQADLHAYYQCSCGARRTRRLYSNIDGPGRPDWPYLQDSHGMPINDTGWVK